LHEHGPQPLTEWVLADERLDFTDELCVSSEREIGFEPPLERGNAELFETRDFDLRERLVREFGERRPAPKIESIAQSLRRELGRRLLRVPDQRLEAKQVELVRADADQVTGLLRGNRVVGSQRFTELRDVVLQRVGGGPGRMRSPELVDEPVCRDDLVRTGEKEREKCPLPRAAKRERMAMLDDLERPQDSELHVFSFRRGVLLHRGDANTHCHLN
jgi:hypothetical protein